MSDPAAGGTDAGTGANTPPSAPGTPPPPPPPPAPPGAPATPQFTQEDVDRLIGQRTAEAQRQATRALVQKLGFEKIEDVERTVTSAREAEKAQMTEAQRLQAEAAEARKAANAEKELLASERHSLSVERALSNAKVQGDTAKLVKLVDVETGADAATVAAAVEKLKTDFPALFGVSTLPSSEPAGGGTPPGRSTSSNQDPLEAGRLKAEAYAKGQRTGL